VGMDDGGVPNHVRFILRSLAPEEAIKVFEAIANRPVFEGAGGGRLLSGRVMPFPEGRSAVAIILQHLSYHGAALGLDSGVAVPVVPELGDLACTDAMMVSAGQERRPRRRTHRCSVKSVIGNAFPGDTRQ